MDLFDQIWGILAHCEDTAEYAYGYITGLYTKQDLFNIAAAKGLI